MKKYLVGGFVRDKLLGRESHDKDFVIVGATEKDLKELGYKCVGKNFPVYLDSENHEIALARKEKRIGPKHTDFEFDFSSDITLEEDLERRDFTINSMAIDIETNRIVDPFNGRKDLDQQILRVVNPEHFIEDPLRVFRGCRFAAQLEFSIEAKTIDLFKSMSKDLENLSADRIWKETERALTRSYDSRLYFDYLEKCNALEFWFPELYKLTTTPEKLEYHPSGNTFEHTMIALTRVRYKKPIVKFAVLCHDLGKGLTPPDILPSHYEHELRGLSCISDLCKRIRVPNDYRDFAELFCKYHMRIAKFPDMSLKKRYDLVSNISDNFKNRNQLCDFLDAFYGDWTGEENKTYWNDIETYDSICTQIFRIFNIVKNIKIEDFSDQEKETLTRKKGVEFGILLREFKIRYLRKKLEE